MRVAMYYNNKDVRLEEIPKPRIGPDEVLVKTWASGICGSDVLEWYRLSKAPLVLGHEITGEISGVGGSIADWKLGDRVFVSHHVPCNMCNYCLAGHESVCDTLAKTNFDPGGFSEYVRVPAINVRNGLYRLPENMSFDEGVFIEPLACVYRGQCGLGWRPGKRVLVIGAGMAGLLHVKLAKAAGAGAVFAADINENRLEAASKSGADAVFMSGENLPELLTKANGGRLADTVIISTGALPALQIGIKCVDRGGKILFFAPSDPGVFLPLPFNELWRKEITMTSTYAGSPRDITAAIDLISSKRIQVEDMITHRLPLAKTQEGFSLVSHGSESIKVIINPQE
jgi:L-iditol 2-dehydrogenase